MPDSTINYTAEGWPTLDLLNYWDVLPAYTEALAAKLAANTSRVIYANGRPDVLSSMDAATQALVNGAGNGTRFESLDRPQGAATWRKDGTTWRVVDGDTGWRRFTPNGSGVAATNTGYIDFRRENQFTTIRFLGVELANPSSPDLANLGSFIPTGFRPPHNQAFGQIGDSGNLAPIGISIYNRITIYVQRADIYPAADGNLVGEFTFRTNDAWPTTLPGSTTA